MEAQLMTQEHLSGAADLERLCFAEPWSEQALELLLGDSALGAVCVEDGIVVAYGGMMLAPGEGQITNIAVHPCARRHGYGKAVLCFLLQKARERRLDGVFLEVRQSNVSAIALYEKAGFATVGVRKRFYRLPPEDALVMQKSMIDT